MDKIKFQQNQRYRLGSFDMFDKVVMKQKYDFGGGKQEILSLK